MKDSPRLLYAVARGHRLRVAHWAGQGRSILALHGFSGVGIDFDLLARRLGASMWAPDLLGHGGSDAPRECEPYAFAAQAQLVSELSAALGLERPVLLGYSFGGRLALECLVRQPQQYAGGVLVGATAGLEDATDRAERVAADARLADRLEAQGVGAFLAEWSQRPIIASQARIDPEHRARMQAERAHHQPWGLANALRQAGTGNMEPLWESLCRVTVPVLSLAGAEDPKFTSLAERLVRCLPNAEHALVPGAGHCAHLEQPDAVAPLVADFLRRVR